MLRKCPATAPVGALIGLVAALALPADRAEAQLFEYTITQVSPTVQTAPVLFVGPYYYFDLTNTNDIAPDSYFLEIRNVAVNPNPNWFPQVCIGAVCFTDTTTLTLGPGASAQVGVNVVPQSDGVGTFEFHINSVGDPGLFNDYPGLTLYAGSAAVDAPQIAASAELAVLGQNTPNPMSGITNISYVLPRDSRVRLSIHDVAGRLIDTLVEAERGAGAHAVAWTGTDSAGR
ncbi:MAG: hypothetical protein HKN12_06790, partial [Gemmatimonadetes bacterium]|nr:hypothetical protein [Gemmatimonadota bacterium]